MNRVGVAELQPGMLLGETLYDDRGGVLLAHGTRLTERYVQAIILRGVDVVRILEPEPETVDDAEGDVEAEESASSEAPPRVVRAGPIPEHPKLPAGAHVSVRWDRERMTEGAVVRSTRHVALLEGSTLPSDLIELGSFVRIVVEHEPVPIPGRLAARGTAGRYLVALGNRRVRGAKRVQVDLPALVRSRALDGIVLARITNLSETGARLEGVEVPIDEELDVAFTPPKENQRVTIRARVVRHVVDGDRTEVGVHFLREIHRPR